MIVYVNGQEEIWLASQTLQAWLESKNMLGKRIAVELNGSIVPKSQLGQVKVKAQDTIEVIAAIGGG